LKVSTLHAVGGRDIEVWVRGGGLRDGRASTLGLTQCIRELDDEV
jgi:hypothetical protein